MLTKQQLEVFAARVSVILLAAAIGRLVIGLPLEAAAFLALVAAAIVFLTIRET